MSSTTNTNIDAAARVQLDYYGAGRYDLAERVRDGGLRRPRGASRNAGGP